MAGRGGFNQLSGDNGSGPMEGQERERKGLCEREPSSLSHLWSQRGHFRNSRRIRPRLHAVHFPCPMDRRTLRLELVRGRDLYLRVYGCLRDGRHGHVTSQGFSNLEWPGRVLQFNGFEYRPVLQRSCDYSTWLSHHSC